MTRINSENNVPETIPHDNTIKVSTISDSYSIPTLPYKDGRVDIPRIQMEIDSSHATQNSASSNFNKKLNTKKKCFASYEALPTKTRKTLKIVLIGITSILGLLAIFFLVRLPAHSLKSDKTIILHREEESFLKVDYALNVPDDQTKKIEEKNDFQIVKDPQGKVQIYGGGSAHRRIPLVPYIDIERVKQKRKYWHEANETEVNTTLERVRNQLNADRKSIVGKELRFWVPGSEPLRILLVSTWRSGSTFLGQLLQTHPGVFQHYEPLSYIGIKQVRSRKDAFHGQQLIHRLLDCDYEKLPEYMNYTKTHLMEMMSQNSPVWNACKHGPNKMACADPTFLSESCQMFPIQLVKTVRLRLNLTQLLLNDEKLRVKVLFLVRDPRGVMSSRYSSVAWCSKSEECTSPEILCQDMEGDLKVASVFEKLYPERFLKLSYEDLAGNTLEEVKKILSFLGLEFTNSIKQYLEDHTTQNKDAPWSTARKSTERISLWKKNLSSKQIQEIQNACGKVLKDLKLELI